MSINAYSVDQYCQSLKNLLKNKIPPIWVQGNITQLTIRGSMVYISLSEFEKSSERPKATLSLYCFLSDYSRILTKIQKLGKPFDLEEGLKVCVQIEADFYTPYGKFQPKIADLDPNFTLGELADTKQKILAQLHKENLIDKNNQLAFPTPCLKIGVITAEGSAAWKDFSTIIETTPYNIKLIPVWTKMQGNKTRGEVCRAIEQLDQTVDVICLIRGGGGKTDLVFFDSEDICRSIANCKTPVLTGIGHQIDEAIADLVSWKSFYTPTHLSQFIIEQVENELKSLTELQRQLRSQTEARFRQAKQILLQSSKDISNLTHNKILLEEERLRSKFQKISSPRGFYIQGQFLKNKAQVIAEKSLNLLESHDQLNIELFERLQKSSSIKIESQTLVLHQKERELRHLDPKRILEKGYAMLRFAESGKIANFENIENNQDLLIETNQGSLKASVLEKTNYAS